ncbi:MAG: tetratricopeptide repeat protein [Myxococcota bacterium]
MRRAVHVLLLGALALPSVAIPGVADAAPARRRNKDQAKLGDLVQRLREAQQSVVKAERIAAKDAVPTEAALAKRLIEGQLKLAEGNYEGAAIAFLDLVENHGKTPAGVEAVYFLGDALTHMDMERWAAELFSRNLSDRQPSAKRFHQLSVARLFDLALPRREAGFARRPGLSATPEVRARLQSVGVDIKVTPPQGIVKREDAERLVQWAESFPRSDRDPQLRYAYGRYLFLTERYDAAVAELETLSPLDIPISRGGPNAQWRVRAAYIAASAMAGAEDFEGALERFGNIVKANPGNPRDRQIKELSYLAIGRIQHDLGESEEAVGAYRKIGRDSPFFPEAMYETAWTLLGNKQYEQAIQALDLLLIYDPNSPISAEIKQLRGKIKIQQRDYAAAEEEFLTLRREFDRLGTQLGRKLSTQADARAYFAAVVGEDMENFSLTSLLPQKALPVARSLDSAVHAEALAQEVGYLRRELDETRDLLARMEEAVQAREKARLFNDLGAQAASLDNVDNELLEVREALVFRLAGTLKGSALDRMESQRRKLKARVEEPLGTRGTAYRKMIARIDRLGEQAHKLDLFIVEMRAGLIAAETYYEQTRKDQKIDRQGFLKQAAELRNEIGALEQESRALRDKIARAKSAVRYRDPLRAAQDKANRAYRQHLQKMWAMLAKAKSDPDAATVMKRVEQLQVRNDTTRGALERAATNRLKDAVTILVEERANLDRYLEELGATTTTTQTVVASVLEAAYSDVVGELANLTMRSEVGLLDVAWAMKEAETDEVNRLETVRDRDLRELDLAIDMGLEDLRQ